MLGHSSVESSDVIASKRVQNFAVSVSMFMKLFRCGPNEMNVQQFQEFLCDHFSENIPVHTHRAMFDVLMEGFCAVLHTNRQSGVAVMLQILDLRLSDVDPPEKRFADKLLCCVLSCTSMDDVRCVVSGLVRLAAHSTVHATAIVADLLDAVAEWISDPTETKARLITGLELLLGLGHAVPWMLLSGESMQRLTLASFVPLIIDADEEVQTTAARALRMATRQNVIEIATAEVEDFVVGLEKCDVLTAQQSAVLAVLVEVPSLRDHWIAQDARLLHLEARCCPEGRVVVNKALTALSPAHVTHGIARLCALLVPPRPSTISTVASVAAMNGGTTKAAANTEDGDPASGCGELTSDDELGESAVLVLPITTDEGGEEPMGATQRRGSRGGDDVPSLAVSLSESGTAASCMRRMNVLRRRGSTRPGPSSRRHSGGGVLPLNPLAGLSMSERTATGNGETAATTATSAGFTNSGEGDGEGSGSGLNPFTAFGDDTAAESAATAGSGDESEQPDGAAAAEAEARRQEAFAAQMKTERSRRQSRAVEAARASKIAAREVRLAREKAAEAAAETARQRSIHVAQAASAALFDLMNEHRQAAETQAIAAEIAATLIPAVRSSLDDWIAWEVPRGMRHARDRKYLFVTAVKAVSTGDVTLPADEALRTLSYILDTPDVQPTEELEWFLELLARSSVVWVEAQRRLLHTIKRWLMLAVTACGGLPPGPGGQPRVGGASKQPSQSPGSHVPASATELSPSSSSTVPLFVATPPPTHRDPNGANVTGTPSAAAGTATAASTPAAPVTHIDPYEARMWSLRVLRLFTIEDAEYVGLITDSVAPLAYDRDPDLRQAAIVATLVSARHLIHDGAHRLNRNVRAMLELALQLLVTDPAVSVRRAVARELTAHFDAHLVLNDFLQALFAAVSDSDEVVGDTVLKVLCRFVHANRGSVMPALNQLQLTAIRDVTSRHVTFLFSRSIRTLTILIRSNVFSVQPQELEKMALQCLSSPSHHFAVVALDFLSAVLECAALTQKHLDEKIIVQQLLVVLKDSRSVVKQLAALRALKNVVYTVILPQDKMLDFPHLYQDLLNLALTPDVEMELVQRGALDVLGVIGAVDELKIRESDVVADAADREESQQAQETQDFLQYMRPPARIHPKLYAKNASIALHALVRLAATSAQHAGAALKCASQVIDESSVDQRPVLFQYLQPLLLSWLSDPDRSNVHTEALLILRQICSFLKHNRDHVPKYAPLLFERLRAFRVAPDRSDQRLMVALIAVFGELARAAPDQLRQNSWTGVFLRQRLNERPEQRPVLVALLHALEAHIAVLDRQLIAVVPQVIEYIAVPSGGGRHHHHHSPGHHHREVSTPHHHHQQQQAGAASGIGSDLEVRIAALGLVAGAVTQQCMKHHLVPVLHFLVGFLDEITGGPPLPCCGSSSGGGGPGSTVASASASAANAASVASTAVTPGFSSNTSFSFASTLNSTTFHGGPVPSWLLSAPTGASAGSTGTGTGTGGSGASAAQPELVEAVLSTLCAAITVAGPMTHVFLSNIERIVERQKIEHTAWRKLAAHFRDNGALPDAQPGRVHLFASAYATSMATLYASLAAASPAPISVASPDRSGGGGGASSSGGGGGGGGGGGSSASLGNTGSVFTLSPLLMNSASSSSLTGTAFPLAARKEMVLAVVLSTAITASNFVSEVCAALVIKPSEVKIIKMASPSGGSANVSGACTAIDFTFESATSRDFFAAYAESFFAKCNDPSSAFRKQLGIIAVGEKRLSAQPTNEMHVCLSRIEKPPARRKESDWVTWLGKVETDLIRCSPDPSIRALTDVLHAAVARPLIPFAFVAFLNEMSRGQRKTAMDSFTKALRMCPAIEVRNVLFALAEFMETDRFETEEKSQQQQVEVRCVVTRAQVTDKFGINYEKEERGMVVAKVAPESPGAMAGVPLGAVLLRIDDHPVATPKDVTNLIANKVQVTLLFSKTVVEQQVNVEKPFFSLEVLATTAFQGSFLAKALHFSEILFEEALRDAVQQQQQPQQQQQQEVAAKVATSPVQLGRLYNLMETVINLYHSLQMRREAKGVLRFLETRLKTSFRRGTAVFKEVETLERLNWWEDARDEYANRLPMLATQSPGASQHHHYQPHEFGTDCVSLNATVTLASTAMAVGDDSPEERDRSRSPSIRQPCGGGGGGTAIVTPMHRDKDKLAKDKLPASPHASNESLTNMSLGGNPAAVAAAVVATTTTTGAPAATTTSMCSDTRERDRRTSSIGSSVHSAFVQNRRLSARSLAPMTAAPPVVQVSDVHGVLRCHRALGDIVAMMDVMRTFWATTDTEGRRLIGPLCGEAAFMLGEWDELDEVAACAPEQMTPVTRAAWFVKNGRVAEAASAVSKQRKALASQLVDSFGESTVSHELLIQWQQTTHFLEVLNYKNTSEERKALTRIVWQRRLAHSSPNPYHWAISLAINSLALLPSEDVETRLQFAKICRNTAWSGLAKHTLTQFLGADIWDDLKFSASASPEIVAACLEHAWYDGKRLQAVVSLRRYIEQFAPASIGGGGVSDGGIGAGASVGIVSGGGAVANVSLSAAAAAAAAGVTPTHTGGPQATPGMTPSAAAGAATPSAASSTTAGTVDHDQKTAWANCFYLLGDWTSNENAENAIEYLRRSVELCPTVCRSWHTYALLLYTTGYNVEGRERLRLLTQAVTALFRGVTLGDEVVVIQDALRILSVWFKYGHAKEIRAQIEIGLAQTPLHLWLRVIPQLVARLDTSDVDVREQLTKLLGKLGEQYPQALIYPLTVCEEGSLERQAGAKVVLEVVRRANPMLAEEASLVRRELVRLAIVWAEKWHEAIHTASKNYKNVVKVLETLQPLFDELDNPATPNERAFEACHAQNLKRAQKALRSDKGDQAWALLKQAYSQLGKTLSSMRSLQLADVSPALADRTGFRVGVPGADGSVTIESFQRDVAVIPSKQKPRRFGVIGSNGEQFRYLLKGHEDMRQDERVMQLFELINAVLKSDQTCFEAGLSIVRYTVVPLSNNVGILGWVEHSETIFKLIEGRRNLHNRSIYFECDLIVKEGGLQDIESFHKCDKETRKLLLGNVCRDTPADELRRVVWEKNDSCESWLAYRRRFTQTMSAMSMVGYILGLGDRHLNNLMIRKGGDVVHIDFGDCFEVAMHRPQFPERVPFRLTRMLVAAMGVMGVDSAFRSIAEHVMSLMRRHKDSLLSVLETFVYDPLINWRLEHVEGEAAAAEAAAAALPRDEHSTGHHSVAHSVTKRMAPLEDEWMHQKELAQLASYLAQHAKGSGKERDEAAAATAAFEQEAAALPEHATVADIVRKIRDALAADDAVVVRLWAEYARSKFPDITNRIAQSVIMMQSIVEKRNDVAAGVIKRVQAKLNGTDVVLIPDASAQAKQRASGSTTGVSTTAVGTQGTTAAAAGNQTSASSASDIGPGGSPVALEGDGVIAQSGGPHNEADAQRPVSVEDQVRVLIEGATSIDNLADAFITGWAPFW